VEKLKFFKFRTSETPENGQKAVLRFETQLFRIQGFLIPESGFEEFLMIFAFYDKYELLSMALPLP